MEGPLREALESLTPAERQQLMTARQKAESDPAVAAAREKVKEAMKEAHEASKAAMLKADPTLGPILEKVEAATKNAMEEFQQHHQGKGKNAPAAN